MSPLGNIIGRVISTAAEHAQTLKGLMSKGGVDAAITKPSTSTVLSNNAQAMAALRNPMLAAEVSLVEVQAAKSPFAIKKAAAAEKREGGRKLSETDEEDSKGLFDELSEEGLSADTEEGGAGGGGAEEDGAGAGTGGGDRRTAGAQQMVDLLKNLDLDPTKSIQSQMDEFLTDPAWQTPSGQAKAAQFIYDHLDKIQEAPLANKVKAHVDKRTELAVRQALRQDLAAGGATTELQDKVDKLFQMYFALVSLETTAPTDELKFMGEQVSGLPGPNGKELPVAFRAQLQHEVGLSMRKLDTFDDHAQFLVCNSAIRLTRAITLLFKDFENVTQRLERQGLTQLAIYS